MAIRYWTASYSPPLSAQTAMTIGTVMSVGSSLTKQLVIGNPVALTPPASSSVTVSAGANATTRITATPR